MNKDNVQNPRKILKESEKIWRYYIKMKRKHPNEHALIKFYYPQSLGIGPDLNNPRTYTEKMQWMKLYYNNPLCTKCADKLKVREYVEQKGHGDLLNRLHAVYDDTRKIDFDALPDKLAIKATHGSGWNIICDDKQKLRKDWPTWIKLMNCWLKQDYACMTREQHYAYIPPRLVCEEFLEGENGTDLRDYKFFCFDGEPRMIQIDCDRATAHKKCYLDADWKPLPIKHPTLPSMDPPAPRPANAERIMQICRDLSAGFPHVRVDLYVIGEKIVFGEMTFTDGSGLARYEPMEFDKTMGDWLTLPDRSSPYVMI